MLNTHIHMVATNNAVADDKLSRCPLPLAPPASVSSLTSQNDERKGLMWAMVIYTCYGLAYSILIRNFIGLGVSGSYDMLS